MTTRNAIGLAGLVLALALLSPASALANAGGTDRPVKCTVSGSTRVDTEDFFDTAAFNADLAGVCTYFGTYTSHAEAVLAFTEGGADCVHDCTATMTAANGDQITESIGEITTADNACIHTATSVQTITGGTGRFADASGTLTTALSSNDCQDLTVIGDCLSGGPSCTLLRDHVVGTTTGRINY